MQLRWIPAFMAYGCLCRACRWGFLGNGPFNEFTYLARVHRDGRCVSTLIDYNALDELQSALHLQGAATLPELELPTA